MSKISLTGFFPASTLSILLPNMRRAALAAMLAGLLVPGTASAGHFGDMLGKAAQVGHQVKSHVPIGNVGQQFKARIQQAAPASRGVQAMKSVVQRAAPAAGNRNLLPDLHVREKVANAAVTLPQKVSNAVNRVENRDLLPDLHLREKVANAAVTLPQKVSNVVNRVENRDLLPDLHLREKVANAAVTLPQKVSDVANRIENRDLLPDLHLREKVANAAVTLPQKVDGLLTGLAAVPGAAPLPLPPVGTQNGDQALQIVDTVLTNLPVLGSLGGNGGGMPSQVIQDSPAPAQFAAPAPQAEEPPPAAAETETPLADLVLVDVELAEEATGLAGPAYRLRFMNQGLAATPKFIAAAITSNDGNAAADAPRAVVEVPGMAAGEDRAMVLRLPRGKSKYLILALDLKGAVAETDKDNNVALVERGE
jgi:hypothetical protein